MNALESPFQDPKKREWVTNLVKQLIDKDNPKSKIFHTVMEEMPQHFSLEEGWAVMGIVFMHLGHMLGKGVFDIIRLVTFLYSNLEDPEKVKQENDKVLEMIEQKRAERQTTLSHDDLEKMWKLPAN